MAKSMKDFVAAAKNACGAVEPKTAHEEMSAKALILDVREADELTRDGAIPGALHIPRGVLESRADPELPTAEPRLTTLQGSSGGAVYVLCASGARASMAAHRLQEMGYRACSIEGGLKRWREAGLPVEGGG